MLLLSSLRTKFYRTVTRTIAKVADVDEMTIFRVCTDKNYE